MIVYTVYEPGIPAKSLDERSDEVVFIKEGFTWWGFLFGPLWLLFNALWLEFIGAVVLSACVAAVLTWFDAKDEAETIAQLLLMLIIGFEGNALRRWRLERKGYVYLASVAGSGLEECERRFFDAWLPTVAGRSARPESKPGAGATPGSFGQWPGPGVVGTFPGSVA